MPVFQSLVRRTAAFFYLRCAPDLPVNNRRIVVSLVFTLFCIFPTLVFSQFDASITGIVTDSTGVPLPGAHIVISGTEIATISDWNGAFIVSGLPSGKYLLSVSFIGCRTLETEVAVHTGQVSRLKLALVPKPLQLPVAEAFLKSSSTYPSTGEIVITRAHWRPLAPRSVGDALRSVPGIEILTGGYSERISLRGAPARATIVELDGVPLNDAGTGEADINSLDLDRIAAISIEFNGLGGRVGLFTTGTEPFSPPKFAAQTDYTAGSFGSRLYSGSLARKYDTVGFALGAKNHYERGDFPYRLDNGVKLRRYNNVLNGWNAHLKAYSSAGLETGAHFEHRTRGIPGLSYASPTPQAALTTARRTGRFAFKSPPAVRDYSAALYLSHYTAEYSNPAYQVDPVTGHPIYHIGEHNLQEGLRWGASTRYNASLPPGRLSLGYTFARDEYLGRDLIRNWISTGVSTGAASRNSHRLESSLRRTSGFGRLAITVAPALQLTYIEDLHRPSESHLAPTINLSVEHPAPSGNIVWFAGWSSTFTPPTFNALFTVDNIFAVGNRNLKPEIGRGTQLSSTYSTLGLPLDLRLTTTLFQRRIEQLIVWRRNWQDKYYPDNLNRTKSIGCEISLQIFTPDNALLLLSSYIYNNNRIDTPGDINRGNLVPLSPLHSGQAALMLKPKPYSLALKSRFAGRRYSTESNLDPLSTADMGLAPYVLWDVSLTRDIISGRHGARLEVAVENIFNRSYRIIERNPMPGRTLYCRLTIDFNRQEP